MINAMKLFRAVRVGLLADAIGTFPWEPPKFYKPTHPKSVVQ